jgi:hypothetical protein
MSTTARSLLGEANTVLRELGRLYTVGLVQFTAW